MTGSTRRAPLLASLTAQALLALVTSGCVTGHLVDAARRRERPIAVDEAALDGERLVLGYTAAITDDRGRAEGQGGRRAAIPLDQLDDASRPVDAYAIERLAPEAPLPGRALALVRPGDARPPPPFVEIAALDDAGSPILELHRGDGAAPGFPTAALTETTLRPWVYPLVPLCAVFDAATVPPLLLLGTPLLVFGD